MRFGGAGGELAVAVAVDMGAVAVAAGMGIAVGAAVAVAVAVGTAVAVAVGVGVDGVDAVDTGVEVGGNVESAVLVPPSNWPASSAAALSRGSQAAAAEPRTSSPKQ
jgi:hypothetical protein